MKQRRPITVLIVILFIVGFSVLFYPTISDQWNAYRQSLLISSYEAHVQQMTEEDFSQAWAEAIAYNATLGANTFIGDAFAEEAEDDQSSPYWQVLNVNGDGIMGYITIPKIDQKLAIYHGTSDEVLQQGTGHLEGTRLPVGVESNHTVISAHRGLPSAKLFTDLDQLEFGDKFYLHILDQILAYEVDEIYPMVDKDNLDELSETMQIYPGEDNVTLLTCTPYGVNTHRLLVRGHRIEYFGEDTPEETTPIGTMVESVQTYYMLYILLAAVIVLVILLVRQIVKNLKDKRKKEEKT